MFEMTRAVTLLRATLSLWSSKNAFQHASALAFYTLFSMAPLVILVVAVVGVVLGQDAATSEIAQQIDDLVGPQAAEAVQEIVRRSAFRESGVVPTALGIVALLMGATTVFAQLQTSLNEFWDVMAKPSRSSIAVFLMTRLASLGLVVVIGFLLLTSFVISVTVAAVLRFADAWFPLPTFIVSSLDVLVSLFVGTVLFGLIFRILPDVQIRWEDTWRGAFITAVLFVGGQFMISAYLTRLAPASAYGAAGSLVVVLLWVYYSSLIIFVGAAFTRASIGLRHETIRPKSNAVRIRREILEDAVSDEQTRSNSSP